MHTIFFLQNVFILFSGLCLENKTCQLVILPAWLQILKRKLLSSGAKVTIWRPFCLCKLGGQDLRISLGNRFFRIQHTLIRLKSPVPNFYSKMPLEVYRALFFRILDPIIVIIVSVHSRCISICLLIFVANVCPCYTFKVVVHCVILDPIVVIIVFEVLVTLFFCLLRSVNRRSPPPLHPWLLAGVVGTLGRLNPRRHFYVCVLATLYYREIRVCDSLRSDLVGKCLYFQI